MRDDWKLNILTVGELRAVMRDLPDGMPVILEKDAEGNGYSPLAHADTDHVYEPDSTWSGEVHDTTDEDFTPAAEDVVVLLLGPVN